MPARNVRAIAAAMPARRMRAEMGKAPAKSLFEAVFRTRVAEDCLTEMLAYVLEADVQVRSEITPLLFVPAAAELGAIVTQRRTPSGRRRIDLELCFDSPAFVVWIEVKDHAKEGLDQLADYQRELEKLCGPTACKLVALAPEGHPILSSAHASPLTWQRVADACETVAHRRGGGPWRSALKPGADHRQLDLRDFISRLQNLGVAMTPEPLSSLDTLIPSRAETLLESKDGTIAQLLDVAVQRMEGFEEIGRYPIQRT